MYFSVSLLFLVATLSLNAQQLVWEAVNSKVQFTIQNAGLEVAGRFTRVEGQFVTDALGKSPVLIIGRAKVKSMDTGIGLRDRHLQGSDYFDAAKYPELRMQLLDISGNQARFAVVIRGKSKTITVPFSWEKRGSTGYFRCNFKLNRRDFGIGGSSLIMGDEVTVSIDLEVRHQ